MCNGCLKALGISNDAMVVVLRFKLLTRTGDCVKKKRQIAEKRVVEQ